MQKRLFNDTCGKVFFSCLRGVSPAQHDTLAEGCSDPSREGICEVVGNWSIHNAN